jgi:5-methylcytosine-specific restriction enzyme subunit McrC
VGGFDRSQVTCRFDDHTADVHDNHVLVWTLHRLGRSVALREETRRKVQRTLYAIGPAARVTPVAAADAIRRTYDRLRQDYRPMHTICRFLLENAGPTHHDGDRESTAFLVQMPLLFERFVAEDLRRRLPSHLRLEAHEKVVLNTAHDLKFDIDLVVRDRVSGHVVLVLDTKYKDHVAPDTSDVSQAVAYAIASGCEAAALVYPVTSSFVRATVGRVPVWRLGMPLDGDLDDAGAELARRVTDVVGAAVARNQGIGGR